MTGYLVRILEFRSSVPVLLLCGLLGGSLVSTVRAGANQQKQDRSVFSEVIQVHVGKVDVYASDKEGNRVKDLTAADC